MNRPIREGLPPAHARIAKLPTDHRGFPVPWFVAWFKDGQRCEPGHGEPDFRVIDTRKISVAVRKRLCWVCGEPLGQHFAFVIGPMCAINRVISEPPSHLDCAVFSAKGCPFLSQPRMRRNEDGLEGFAPAAGFEILRNPGVTCVWVTKSYQPFRTEHGNAGVLFRLGNPSGVTWYAKGREATRAEVLEAIDSGFPTLVEMAKSEGKEALQDLMQYRDQVTPLLPAA